MAKLDLKNINDFKNFSNPPKPLLEKIFYLVIQILIVDAYKLLEWRMNETVLISNIKKIDGETKK